MTAKQSSPGPIRVAIQGELGSNSHMAALAVFPFAALQMIPCALAVEVFERVAEGEAVVAVLPIENSLHGSVFEHYDLLLQHGLRITGESMLRIRHNVMAMPGVRLAQIRRVMSHPVALSQCRRWLRAHKQIEVVAAYDTAGSVKNLIEQGWHDVAGIAPMLAAQVYDAAVLVEGIEDHEENWTRFYTLQPGPTPTAEDADKMSVAFTLPHRPGSLLGALAGFEQAGLNLTKIESRPVPGKPWEYVFFVDVRFEGLPRAERVLADLRQRCDWIEVLGVYRAA